MQAKAWELLNVLIHQRLPPCPPPHRRLWLFGGELDGGRCTAALHWWDLRMAYWAAVDGAEAGAASVEPRAQ